MGARPLQRGSFLLALCVFATCATTGGLVAAGRQLQQQNRLEEAIAQYQAALDTTASYEAHLGLAECYLGLRQYQEALQAAQRAQQLGDGEAALWVMVDAHIALETFEEAAELVRDLMIRHPEAAEYPFRLGVIQLSQTDPEAAIYSFERALTLDPDLLEARLHLANVFGDLERYDDALAAIGRGLAHERQAGRPDLPLQLLLGQMYERMNRPEDAGTIYDAILRKHPKEVEALAGRGRVLRTTGKLEQSIESLLSASKRHPESPDLLVELGLSYRDFAVEPMALEALLLAVSRGPLRAHAYFALLALMQKHDSDRDAIFSVVTAAARALPKNVDIQMRFAKGLIERKRYDEALPPVEQAVKIEPSSVEANFTLGVVQVHLGQLEAANASRDALRFLDPAQADRLAALITQQQRHEQGSEQPGSATQPAQGKRKRRKKKTRRRARRQR